MKNMEKAKFCLSMKNMEKAKFCLSMKNTKKAQAAFVAGFILVLGLILVAYLFLLPSEEKCKIMPDLKECEGIVESVGGSVSGKGTFFSASPGLITLIEESAEYDLGTVELLNKEITEIPFKLSGDSSVEKGWFRERKITQEIEIPGDVEQLWIFLGIGEQTTGTFAVVKLNDEVVAKVSGEMVHVIDVPLSIVRETNKLEITASSPWIPGTSNKFKISSLIIKTKYSLTQNLIERNFAVPNFDKVKKATFEFDADCYSTDELTVRLNNRTIAVEKICAEYRNDIKEFLQEDNKLTFMSDGSYFVHNMKLKLEFSQRDYPTYYFLVSKEKYQKIDEGKLLAMLKLKFSTTEKKELKVIINGNPINIETAKSEYKTAVGRLLMQGQNSLRIEPETSVTLGNIEIYFE